MKLKIIFISSLILLITFLIYLTTIDRLVYFLPLGDSLAMGRTPYGEKDCSYNEYIKEYLKENNLLEEYIDDFLENNYRLTDLIRDIEDNKKVVINNKEQTIKNALIKADLITLAIGMEEIYYKVNTTNLNNENIYEHFDEIINDLDKLFTLLKIYCKEDIIIINYYRSIILLNNPQLEEAFNYINNKLEAKCQEYKIHYIKINDLLENNNLYLPNPTSYYPSQNGYEIISKKILKTIEKTLLK